MPSRVFCHVFNDECNARSSNEIMVKTPPMMAQHDVTKEYRGLYDSCVTTIMGDKSYENRTCGASSVATYCDMCGGAKRKREAWPGTRGGDNAFNARCVT